MSDEDVVANVARLISQRHAEHAIAPTRQADSRGAFMESIYEAIFGDALALVVDANVLKNNIGRAARDGKRPILSTGANAGTFRLFAARHVVSEVEEHSARWADEMDIDGETFAAAWADFFVPFLRVVPTEELHCLLNSEERARINGLSDRDDVPSATLALALSASFLTEDADAHYAAYGKETDAETRRRWLDPLRRGSDAGELKKLMAITAAVPAVSVSALFKVGRVIYEKSPLALAAIGAVIVYGCTKISPETRAKIWNGIGTFADSYNKGVVTPYNDSIEQFRSIQPEEPDWDSLVPAIGRDAALTRACLFTTARSRGAPVTASQIATALPFLGVAQNRERIGKILRSNTCFFEPYYRRWQVGHPINTTSEDTQPQTL